MAGNELKPVRCGCGGATRRCADPITGQWFVQCRACGTVALYYNSEAEAVTAWNKAMGADKVDELMEHIWREKLDTREKIANLVERMLR